MWRVAKTQIMAENSTTGKPVAFFAFMVFI
jgi:hypothetical protein